jgi:asparagine synthase (glutamine-hydrolysing)
VLRPTWVAQKKSDRRWTLNPRKSEQYFMCGITGFLDTSESKGHEELCAIVQRMATSLRHRGPEDEGIWADAACGIAFGHRRLSIIDLSAAGHQPMHSSCGRYVITFNGEIYNFKALRQELESLGQTFRGHSDTEVMLASIAHWGVENAVKKFNGMFAFGLWDRKEKTLYLSRDRAGEKPLYYGWAGKTLLFGSELKALHQHPAFRGEIDRGALTIYVRHNYIPAPHSIYKGIFKLIPGTLLTIRGFGSDASPKPYWSAKNAAEDGLGNPFKGSEAEAVDQLDTLLNDAVSMRMEADVPLGAFLSGGIDSSLVVAIMQANSSRPVKTFTIGFENSAFNEAESAKAVAKHIGTEHTELYVTPAEAMGVIPLLPTLYDEPFADSSQIPTFLVSQLARRKVTVSLSGDGGDELFGGYDTYLWGRSVQQNIGWMPRTLKAGLAKSLKPLSRFDWNALLGGSSSVLPQSLRRKDLNRVLQKLAGILNVNQRETLYRVLCSYWMEPASIVIGAKEPLTALTDPSKRAQIEDFMHVMMYLDTLMYLPDDILVKVDRAAMGVSLESRVPLLDHRVIEFAWKLPLAMKVKGNTGKRPLRQLLHRYVPKNLVDRPKQGFGVPIHEWLRGPMRPWAEELLNESRLKQEGYFSPAPIRQKWSEHVSARHNWQPQLWGVLMFQSWLEQHKSLISGKVEDEAVADASVMRIPSRMAGTGPVQPSIT